MDTITDEQKALFLKKLGLNPWDAQVVVDNGQIRVIDTPSQHLNPFDATVRAFGSKLPRQAAGLMGGLTTAGLAQPYIAPVATAVGGVSGPLGVVTGPATELVGSALAFGAGDMAGRGIYDKTIGPSVNEAIYPNEATRLRAQAEHPWVEKGTDWATMAATLQFSNPLKLAKALGQATRLGMLRRGETALTKESKDVLTHAARNVVGNTVGTAGLQAITEGKVDPKELATTALVGLFFGEPRWPLKHIQPGAERVGVRWKTGKWPVKEPAEIAPIPEGPGEQKAAPEPPPLPREVRVNIMYPSGEMMNYPPWNPEDPIGLNIARIDGRLAQQMADARLGKFGRGTANTMGPELPSGYVGTADPMDVPFGPQVPEHVGPELPPGYAGPSTGDMVNMPQPKPTNSRQLLYFLRGLKPENMVMRGGENRPPTTADGPLPEQLAPGRTEEEILQDRLEGRRVRYQPAKKDKTSLEAPAQEVEVMSRGLGSKDKMPVYTPTPHEESRAYQWYKQQQARAQDLGIEPDFADSLIAHEGDMLLAQGKFAGEGDLPPSSDNWIPKARQAQKLYIQRQGGFAEGEGYSIDVPNYQPAKNKNNESPLGPEREALKRRGFEFTETQDPIIMPNGGLASGSTDARTGEIKISLPHVQADTHVHEGMHAELVDMANSPNPHVRQAATEILEAAHNAPDPEEFLVNLATAHSRGARDQNPVMRYLADNWNALMLIAGHKTPERMARTLAERFDILPGAPVNQGNRAEGIKHQPINNWLTDDQGNKLPLYHGAVEFFNSFKPSKRGSFGSGVYLSADPEVASRYAVESAEGEKRSTGAQVYKLHAGLSNPLKIKQGPLAPKEALMAAGYTSEKADAVWNKALENHGNLGPEIQSKLKAMGHDGIVVVNPDGTPHEVVVFDPAQVKSATANTGAFDNSTRDIRYQPLHTMFPDKFKQWFGDYEQAPDQASKVVDENGRPLVLMHGTKRPGFDKFDMDRTVEMGMHFGDAAQANDFVASTPFSLKHFTESTQHPESLLYDSSRKDAMFPVYLNIRKPLTAPDKFGTDSMGFLAWLHNNRIIDPHYIDAATAQAKMNEYKKSWDIIKQGLMDKGYDGVKYVNKHEGNAGDANNIAWIAFHPEQIKSAIGNQGEFSKRNPDIRYQELTSKDQLVPSSVLGKAAEEDPRIGRAAAKAFNEIDINMGHINKATEALTKLDPEVVQSAIWKRSRAGQFKTAPQFTPEEAKANAIYQQVMDVTAALATKHGYPIDQMDNYVPEALSAKAARAYEDNGEKYIQEILPKFLDLNAKIFKSIDAKDAEEYLRNYLKGVSIAPNSLGSEFGALTKSKRQYHLPDEMRETDMIKNLQRYGARWARGVAIKQHIRNDPYVAGQLGYEKEITHPSGVVAPATGSIAKDNLRAALDDTLFNVGRGSTGTKQDVRDVVMAGQQVVNSATMQTLSNIKNTIAKVPMHLINAQNPEQAEALVSGTMRTISEWATQKQKAIEANVIKPQTDPTQDTDGALLGKTAERLRQVGLALRKYTASEFLETFNRVHDFTIGEDLAKVNIELAKRGDADAIRFMEQFGYGADHSQPLAEQITRIARNYAKGIQGTYSAEGLPAVMLRGGPLPMALRIQRFGVENFNRTRLMVVKPAMEGNYGPLVAYTLGLAVTAPIVKMVTEFLSGRPSGLPTTEEIKAGKKNMLAQKTLNIMQMAQITGAFGTAGNIAGTVASNIRGGRQQIIGDPSISFASDFAMSMAAAAEAIRQDEPAIGVLQEVLKRTIIDNMQLARGLTTDRGEAQDMRNKRTFEYQNEQRQVPISDMVSGAVMGNLFSDRTPQISPTKDAAKKGNIQAWLKTPVNERAALDNYRGGFEDIGKEGAYQQYVLKTQGPEALKKYQERRLAAKRKAQPH